ncbi:MAG TPA: hypothetical protein VJH23_03940 [archaeon]|nr:hypothetical protein [archaeon]
MSKILQENKNTETKNGDLMVVAFDTNMLLNIERFGVDIFRQAREMFGRVEFVVPLEVVKELDGLSNEGQKLKKEAKIAKIAMEKNMAKVVDFGQKNADLALLKMAPEAVIGTNDKELKDSVRELSGRVLILRQRKFLELD